MKLQLTVPALERLIGGDTELELDLRKAAAKEFGRKYMKDMMETAVSEEICRMRQEISQLISDEVKAQIEQKEPKLRASIYIDESTVRYIRKEVKYQVEEIFKQTIIDLIKTHAATLDIERLVRVHTEPAIVERAKLVAKNELIKSLH